jgi:hypothetical protein
MTIEAGCHIYTPTIAERFWRAMGFRSHHPETSETGEQLPFWIMTNVHLNVSILDRIRLLISGNAIVRVEVRTDVAVNKTESASSFEIERPWLT